MVSAANIWTTCHPRLPVHGPSSPITYRYPAPPSYTSVNTSSPTPASVAGWLGVSFAWQLFFLEMASFNFWEWVSPNNVRGLSRRGGEVSRRQDSNNLLPSPPHISQAACTVERGRKDYVLHPSFISVSQPPWPFEFDRLRHENNSALPQSPCLTGLSLAPWEQMWELGHMETFEMCQTAQAPRILQLIISLLSVGN